MELLRKPFWAGLGVSLIAAAPYLGAIGGYFTGDDFGYVYLYAKEHFPTGFVSLFWSDWSLGIWGRGLDEIRPVIALSYWLDSRWGAGSPTAYHVTNVAFHVASSLLVFAIGRVVGLSLPAATFSGGLFAVLAVHAEAVAWITGRVDSLPALLYLLTFLAFALWRRTGMRWLYGVSVAAFFLALFSKQSAITMVGTLVLYDIFTERRSLRLSLARVRPYVPFVVLTAGYLLQRRVLFNNVVRENMLSASTLFEYGQFQATQLQILVFGARVTQHGAADMLVSAALAATFALGVAESIRFQRSGVRSYRAVALFFGAVWWLICTAPLLVTYPSARHLYLPAVGPVIALGVLFDALWSGGISRRFVAAAAGVGLILASGARLQPAVAEWSAAAAVSEKVVRDVERELAAAPIGSLFVLDVPAEGPSKAAATWVWSYASPFALRPPFTAVDLTERVSVVEPQTIYCCWNSPWLKKIRSNVDAWARRAEHPPVFILRWDAATGAMTRRSDQEEPSLRSRVAALVSASTVREACAQLNALLTDPGEARTVCDFDNQAWYLGRSSQPG